MKRLMLAAIVAVMIFIPVVIQAGGVYERDTWQERRIIQPAVPYPAAISYPSTRPCEKKIAPAPCPKRPEMARATSSPRQTEKICVTPCIKDMRKMSCKLEKLEKALKAARERERADSVKLQKLERENGILQERDRADSAKLQKLERKLGVMQERERVYREWYYTGWLPWKNRQSK